MTIKLITHKNTKCLKETQCKSYDELPQELLFFIAMKFEDVKDICNFQCVNRISRIVGSDDIIWRKLCCEKFSVPLESRPPSWKELYKFNHFLFQCVILKRKPWTKLDLGNGLAIYI